MFGVVAAAAAAHTYRIDITSDQFNWSRSVNAPLVKTNVKVHLIITIGAGVVVASSSLAGGPAMLVDNLFPGSRVDIINNGHILGKGGRGGGSGGSATAGGPGLQLSYSGLCFITNGSGTIRGGGGGGGVGGPGLLWDTEFAFYDTYGGTVGGGGGGGSNAGTGGNPNGGTATSGPSSTPGAGGSGTAQAGTGGAGGAYGASGSSGGGGTRVGGPSNGTIASNGGAGAAAGAGVKYGSATLTWISGMSNVVGAIEA